MKFLRNILAILWLWVLPATFAAGVLAVFVAITGGDWPWFIWLLLSPILYLGWLCAFLYLCALTISRMGKRFPKPRFAIAGADRGLITVTACSSRMHLIY